MWKSLDLAYHAKKIITTLDSIIVSLDSSKTTVNETINQPVLERLAKLGEHHLEYGLKAEYYKVC